MLQSRSDRSSCRPERCHSHAEFHGRLESEVPALYKPRFEAIVELLLGHEHDVVCLQELWFNDQCVCAADACTDAARFLSDLSARLAGRYQIIALQRPCGKADGVALLVAREAVVKDTQRVQVGGDSTRVVLIAHISIHGYDVVVACVACAAARP